jgi:hypothetical protein
MGPGAFDRSRGSVANAGDQVEKIRSQIAEFQKVAADGA